MQNDGPDSTDKARAAVQEWVDWCKRTGAPLPCGLALFSPKPCCYGIVERLECDVRGSPVHVDYYRQDCADALAEILRLRRLVRAYMEGSARGE